MKKENSWEYTKTSCDHDHIVAVIKEFKDLLSQVFTN